MTGPAMDLEVAWSRALGGDATSQAGWALVEGSGWSWREDGLCVTAPRASWTAVECDLVDGTALQPLDTFMIECGVTGEADAAGISFGPWVDFLVPISTSDGWRQLQLEVDPGVGGWRFRADAAIADHFWPDMGKVPAGRLLDGRLTLKVRGPAEVTFREVRITRYAEPCRLSIIVVCHRFLQRLRVALGNWCRQTARPGSYEVIVVNPASPDGTHEHLKAVAHAHPSVRVAELAADPALARNKGALINLAGRQARGDWVLLTDADCIFPPDTVERVLRGVARRPDGFLFGERRHLGAPDTHRLLAGAVDGVEEFDALAESAKNQPSEVAPWGYTQIVPRALLESVPYSERVDHFAHSDCIFTAACEQNGVPPSRLEGLLCLHLDHPFSWYGTHIAL